MWVPTMARAWVHMAPPPRREWLVLCMPPPTCTRGGSQSIAPAAGCACGRATPHPPALVECTQHGHWSKITGLAPVVAVAPLHLRRTGGIPKVSRTIPTRSAPGGTV